MGVVYKAQDLKLDRFVALKFLPQHLHADEAEKQRFIHEARAASALDHPNICTIYEIDETADGQIFIAMAFYEGETLKQKVASSKALSGGQWSVASVIDIAIQMAQGLAKAHQHGITHRDIKPANVIITKDGVAKILDFGLAKFAGQTRLTKTDTTVGTPAYMSPEQINLIEVDHRTDIWSLGVVLYEMIANQMPFKGEYEQALMYSIVNEKPEPLARYKTGVSEGLQHIIDKALDKDRETRYQHVDELLADLKRERKTGSISTKPVSRIKSRKIKRAVTRYASVAVVAILVMVLGVWLFNRQPAQIVQPKHRQVTFTGDATWPAISPDGEFVAYVTGKSGAMEVIVEDLISGQSLKVFQSPYCENVLWSPDGSEIAFNAQVSNLDRTIILPRLGGDSRVVPGIDLKCWSPDGAHFAYGAANLKRIAIKNKETHENAYLPLTGSLQWKWYVDWSPRGDRFLVVTEGQNEYAIWTLKIDGSEQQIIVTDDLKLHNARWAANGSGIYYLRFDGQTSSLMKVPIEPRTGKADGRPVSLLTGLAFGPHFTITKDNKGLLYSRELNASNLWLVTLKQEADSFTFDTKQLTSSTSWNHDPAISPDGKQIAFSIGKRPRANIYLIPLDGGQKQQLTFLNSYNAGAAWSPDGNEIAFGSNQDRKNRVWKISARGGTPHAYTKSKMSGDMFHLTWSPGANILYDRPGNTYMHFLDPETEKEQPLFDQSIGWTFWPRYSLDKKHLAAAIRTFGTRDESIRGIWLISVDERKAKLLQKGYINPLKWSNDGEWIFGYTTFTDNVDILKIPKDGGQSQVIVTLPWAERDGETILAMSPDDNQIVVPVTSLQSDVWLVQNFDPENEPKQPVEFDKTGLQQLTYLQKGESLLGKKEYAQAEAVFREGLALDSEHLTLSKRLAYCMQLQSRFEEAEQLYRKAYKKSPEDQGTHYELAWSLYHQQKYNEALAFAEKALAQDSSFTNHNLIARILVSGDINIERGVMFAEKAIANKLWTWQRTAADTPYLALPEHTLGLAYLKKGEYQKAVQYLEQVAAFAPERENLKVDLQLARQKLQEMKNK